MCHLIQLPLLELISHYTNELFQFKKHAHDLHATKYFLQYPWVQCLLNRNALSNTFHLILAALILNLSAQRERNAADIEKLA